MLTLYGVIAIVISTAAASGISLRCITLYCCRAIAEEIRHIDEEDETNITLKTLDLSHHTQASDDHYEMPCLTNRSNVTNRSDASDRSDRLQEILEEIIHYRKMSLEIDQDIDINIHSDSTTYDDKIYDPKNHTLNHHIKNEVIDVNIHFSHNEYDFEKVHKL